MENGSLNDIEYQFSQTCLIDFSVGMIGKNKGIKNDQKENILRTDEQAKRSIKLSKLLVAPEYLQNLNIASTFKNI